MNTTHTVTLLSTKSAWVQVESPLPLRPTQSETLLHAAENVQVNGEVEKVRGRGPEENLLCETCRTGPNPLLLFLFRPT